MTQFLDVLGLDASDDVVRTLALALPLFFILTLLLLAVRARSRAKAQVRKSTLTSVQTSFEDRSAGSQCAEPAAADGAVSTGPAGHATPGPVSVAGAQPDAAQPAVIMPPQPDAHDAIGTLQAQLNEAMKSPPNATLAPLFLSMARHHKAAGDESSYLAALRSAAGLAAQHGPRSAHAEARLELAEAAFKSGDLIGACEQWQIARDALNDDGQKAAYAAVDKRMRDNGCPTDWVLTDF